MAHIWSSGHWTVWVS